MIKIGSQNNLAENRADSIKKFIIPQICDSISLFRAFVSQHLCVTLSLTRKQKQGPLNTVFFAGCTKMSFLF